MKMPGTQKLVKLKAAIDDKVRINDGHFNGMEGNVITVFMTWHCWGQMEVKYRVMKEAEEGYRIAEVFSHQLERIG